MKMMVRVTIESLMLMKMSEKVERKCAKLRMTTQGLTRSTA